MQLFYKKLPVYTLLVCWRYMACTLENYLPFVGELSPARWAYISNRLGCLISHEKNYIHQKGDYFQLLAMYIFLYRPIHQCTTDFHSQITNQPA